MDNRLITINGHSIITNNIEIYPAPLTHAVKPPRANRKYTILDPVLERQLLAQSRQSRIDKDVANAVVDETLVIPQTDNQIISSSDNVAHNNHESAPDNSQATDNQRTVDLVLAPPQQSNQETHGQHGLGLISPEQKHGPQELQVQQDQVQEQSPSQGQGHDQGQGQVAWELLIPTTVFQPEIHPLPKAYIPEKPSKRSQVPLPHHPSRITYPQNSRAKKWSDDEDARLVQAVGQYGEQNWKVIASMVRTRNSCK
jgi:hypothetical protein